LGFGFWVLGDGPQPPTPNPQSPIPNPHGNKKNNNQLFKLKIIHIIIIS